MAALVVAQAYITDAEKFKNYGPPASNAVKKFGGRLLGRSAEPTKLEGDWPPGTVVILEFESLQQAQAWYDSPEYKEAIAAREGAATFHMIAMEGA